MLAKLRVVWFCSLLACPLVANGEQKLGSELGSELSPEQLRGKSIYTSGVGTRPLYAILAGPGIRSNASLFPCINCHGEDGLGRLEGGVRAADISWQRLRAPADAVLDFGRNRPPYDDALFARALRTRIDAGGNELHVAMPSYVLEQPDMLDLLAYLKVVGMERVPGISETSIRIGIAVPTGGPLAGAGEFTFRVVSAYAAALNERGGIYGRRLEIVKAAYDPAVPQSTLAAIQSAIEQHPVFCFLANVGLDDNLAASRLIEDAGVPVVAPLGFPAESSYSTARNSFYVYSSMADQARVLIDYLATDLHASNTSIALLHADDRLGRAASAGVEQQIGRYGIDVAVRDAYPPGTLDSATAVAKLSAESSSALIFFGPGRDLANFLREAHARGWQPTVLSSAETAGPAMLALDADIAATLHLSSPLSNPDLESLGMVDFLQMTESRGIEPRYKAFQLVAYAGARVLEEALTRAGRSVTRATFVERLTELWKFDTGTVPPLSYDANRRVGLVGALIVKIDSEQGRFFAASDWREPR